jgi:hypothetical protein
MNRVIVAVMVLLMSGCASAMPMNARETNLQIVIETPGHSKEQIFEKSKQWIALNFRSAKSVIEYENKAEGKIMGNGSANVPKNAIEAIGGVQKTAHFTMVEDIKDGKARLTFENIMVYMPASYNTVTGAFPGGESIPLQGEFERIKPVLLQMPGDSQAFILAAGNKYDGF